MYQEHICAPTDLLEARWFRIRGTRPNKIEIPHSFLVINNVKYKTIIMAKLKGEVTFKVTFKGLGVPIGFGYTNAIIYKECAEQVYASAPWSKIGHQKNNRFKVELIEKNIERDI